MRLPGLFREFSPFFFDLIVIDDPSRDAWLLRYALEGDEHPLYQLLAPRLGTRGHANTALVGDEVLQARGAGARISELGPEPVRAICRAVREEVGPEVSLCTDYFGESFVTVDEAIRIGHAIEPFNLAWIEDVLPWADIAGHKRVADALLTIVAFGEDLYLF